MKFGSFIFPVSHNPENDGAVIDDTLAEIELQESLGFEATWLTEHHFDGASAYVDPVVFAAAVAVRTTRIKIGFAVIEMAFHFLMYTCMIPCLWPGLLFIFIIVSV